MPRTVALVVAVLAGLPLAGCLGDGGDRPVLRTFTAVYESQDGTRTELRLDGPYDLLGPDGEVRPAYTLAYRGADRADAEWSHEDLDATLRVVRHEGCYIIDVNGCMHERIDFRPWSDHASWGIGLPLRLPVEGHGDLVRVADPNADPEDLADVYYEYRVGELWPQRYLRESKDFGLEHEVFRLVSVIPGEPLSGAAVWPVMPAATQAAPLDALFPGSGEPFLDLPFTVTEAVAALRNDPEGAQALDGGCIVGVQHFPHWGGTLAPLSLPPPPSLFPTNEGDLYLSTVDSAGVHGQWVVRLVRDALGAESFEVESSGGTWHTGFTCQDRAAPEIPASVFLAQVPATLTRGDRQSFTMDWWRHPDKDGLAQASYGVQWFPEDGGHYRSATMDAATGWWLGFSYLPGEGMDPGRP